MDIIITLSFRRKNILKKPPKVNPDFKKSNLKNHRIGQNNFDLCGDSHYYFRPKL